MAKVVRKKYIIKRGLQMGLLLETALFMLLIGVIVGCTMYVGVFKTLLFELSGEKISLLHHALSFRLLIWFLPSLLAIAILSLLLTHRIAGPLFVFQRALRKMANGESVDRVHLRKNDRLKDVAEDLNRLIDYFKKERTPQ